MSSPQSFFDRRTAEWETLEEVARRKDPLHPEEARALPAQLRRLCKDRAVAEERMYGGAVTSRLNQLVMQIYEKVYRPAQCFNPFEFMLRTLPGLLSHHRGLLLISMLFFWVPFLLIAGSPYWSGDYIASLLGAEGMHEIDQMYGREGDPLEYGREVLGQGSDFLMFCYYVENNVSIDFQCFAGGILFGIGTVFYTVYNGLFLGAVVGYVHEAGDPTKLYTFVAGHAAFELMGLHLSTLAGFKLGLSLLRPGNEPRLRALVKGGREALMIVVGAGILTFAAAIIEGFWSGGAHPHSLKYGVGVVLFILVVGYLFSGKKQWYERR